ncbi:MAG: pantoate--beta-alanine ligase [Candidatus Omnitrophica bacterium]|nr:pantoate--beta-alanine ligase [Candidatus Omnitrophota bacterium]
MRIIRSPKQMFEVSQKLKKRGCRTGLVPTMGALHKGHLSLIRRAAQENDKVVVSIFVNPIQFGPKEDFRRYPRNLKKDALLCRNENADFIFYPSAALMYPPGFRTQVSVRELSDVLCGAYRPGHFQGVTTVVAKLFNIVMPDTAYFGQKDAQQALIIQRMAKDLDMPVKIRVMPIIREKDGLAMSSRNAYLDSAQREKAAVLYQALNKARESVKSGIADCALLTKRARATIIKNKPRKIDYISIVDMETLEPVKKIKDKALLALAVWFGNTRLIDNVILKR